MRTAAARALPIGLGLLALALAVEALASGEAVREAVEREDYETAIALLSDQLDRTPGDESARFELARVLGWSGDYTRAIAAYEALIAERPDNVDYAFGHAQVLAWADRDTAALGELERARTLAPAYEDVWQLEFSLLRRSGPAGRARLETLRPQAERRFPNAEWWASTSGDAGAQRAATELTVSRVVQTLSTAAPDWRTTVVRATHDSGAGPAFSGSIQIEQRFGQSDTIAGAGASFDATSAWRAGVDLELGPDADFMPRTSLAGWASRPVASSWETVVRLQQRRYEAGEVTTGAATAARYIGDFRAAYTLNVARLRGEATSVAHVATLDYYASPKLELALTLAQGQEAEATAPGIVSKSEIRAITVGARHRLRGRFELDWWLGAHRQGTLYRRQSLGVSFAAGL